MKKVNPAVICHRGGDFGNVSAHVNFSIGGLPVTRYVPGLTYDVQITVEPANKQAAIYGFQATSMSELSMPGGTWKNLGINVRERPIFQNDQPRTYVEHSKGGSASNVFKMKWQAPPENSGTVTFFFDAIASSTTKRGFDNASEPNTVFLIESPVPFSRIQELRNCIDFTDTIRSPDQGSRGMCELLLPQKN